MPTISETFDFVFDAVSGAGKEVGGVVAEAVKEVGGVFVPDFLKSPKSDKPSRQESKGGDTYIDINIECPYEYEECERCGECGKEDWEDVEDFEE
jgi:hypothetical protein